MNTRYTFGGDEHIFVEVDEEMSLDAFFKSLSMTTAIRDQQIDGVTEICPANASFQIKFNPDVIAPDELLATLKKIEAEAEHTDNRIETRIVEVPVLYQDPWTHETQMRFRERHQAPDSTDLEYAAQVNGYQSVNEFLEAHHGWLCCRPTLPVSNGRAGAANPGTQIFTPPHRYAKAGHWLRRLLYLYLLSKGRRRLSDVWCYTDAYL